MTSEVVMDDEYREIELYLRQAQEEIGQALSHLQTTGSSLESTNKDRDTIQDPKNSQDPTDILKDLSNPKDPSDTGGVFSTWSTSLSKKKSEIPDNARGNADNARESSNNGVGVREGVGSVAKEGGKLRERRKEVSDNRGKQVSDNREDDSPRDVNANRADLTTVSGDPDNDEECSLGSGSKHQTVDFLSIFAQNDLLEDNSDILIGRSQADYWNFTLPNPRKRPKRPKTLTPPPRLQVVSNNPYKNQDWRSYVKGEFGFQPIQTDVDNNQCNNTRENRKPKYASTYTKPKPKNPYVSSVKDLDDVESGYVRRTGVSLQRSSSAPVRPIPTKPQSGVRLGAQVITTHRKITFNTSNKANGFQRPRSMNDARVGIGVTPLELSLSPRGTASDTNLDDIMSDKKAVQTENVVESLPSIRSPTIERKNINFPNIKAEKLKDIANRPGDRMKNGVENTAPNVVKEQKTAVQKLSGGVSGSTKKPSSKPPEKGEECDENHTNTKNYVNGEGPCAQTPKLSRSTSASNTHSVAKVPGTTTRYASPTRTAQPALAIPPPPKVEDPPRSSKVVIRQPSPEKQHWENQPRSRSNSGSEIDLARSRTERRTQSTFEKVSTSTQTDKRAERRRKSDPGFLSRGLLRAARTKYSGTPGYIKPSKLDTDNNNIQTAVVKPMKPVMGNRQVALHRQNDNDKKTTDLNKNSGKKSSPRNSKSSKTDIVVVANHNQEGKRKCEGDSRNDITVQVEVFVSCTDNEVVDSRSHNYYDTAGRAWARERRVSAKPLMPVIAEVQKGSDDDDSGSDTEAFDSSTSSSTQSQHGGYTRSLSSTASNSDGVPSPDGPAPPLPPRQVRVRPKKPPALKIRALPGELTGVSGKRRSAPTPPGSPMPRSPRSPLSSTSSSGSAVSLLDSLHRRYYPGMYNPQCPNTRHSNPEMGTAPAENDLVPHSKSASFADDKFPGVSRYHRPRAGSTPERPSEGGARIEMLSEEKTQRMAELLAQLAAPPPSDGSSTIGSSAGSPCSTLSPPTLRRLRPGGATYAAGHHDSSEAESSYGSLSSSKGVEVPTTSTTCEDTCQAAIDQTLQSVKSERELAEIEAVEACKWLRAAGFPQYAQMYEDQLFPIDIASVEKDHDFLDTDSIQSLFRRLNTLNKCANMKIEAPPRKSGDESDEEEQCALSDRWRFQRSSRRWSRRDLDDLVPANCNQHHLLPNPDDSMDKSGLRSCSSHDSVLTDTEPSLTHLDDSPLLHTRSTHRHGSVPDSPSYAHPAGGTTLLVPPPGGSAEKSERRSMSPISPRLRRAASERFRGAKIFLKRIESFKTKKSKKKPGTTGAGGRVEISGPVVVDSSAFQERMDRLGCVEISPTSETPPPSSPFSGADSISGRQSQRSPQITGDLSLSPNTHGPLRLCHSTASGISSSEPMHQHLVLSKQASASVVGGGLSPMNKRDGRVFLDSSSSFPSGSSTLSDSHSEDPLYTLEQLAPPAGAAHPSGHRRNHSSSDIMDMYSGGNNPNQQLKQGSSPMLVSNGYIDVGNGSQINYRTGSFNMGSESEDYKEGIIRRTTAKRAVADSSGSSPQHQGAAGCSGDTAGGQKQRENRLSVYDNVPVSAENANAQLELDMILHDLFENINGLSQSLGQCMNDENTATDSEVKSGAVQPSLNTTTTTTGSDSDQYDTAMPPAIPGTDTLQEDKAPTAPLPPLVAADSTTHHPHYQQRAPPPLPMAPVEDQDVASASSSTHEMSDGDTAGSREEDGSDQPESARERRDSGVGSSLTRAPSDRRRHRIRWHSFVKSHRPSLTSRSLQICNMSAGQLMVLRKLSLLKVTALMEKYSPTNRSGWNWIMPKFIKRFKVPDYKDKQVFGVPLLVVLQRTGQPLPQCILYAMRSLRRTARDAVGIFRKSGVRSRIQKLHNQIESNPECMDFDQLQAYDVADLLKQYFRELPECLLTNKLSETFIASFTHVPAELRLDALQAAVMLLPDENREVLQSLLLFLSDMAEHASENQMTASNLAVCFAPSLFHMCGPRNNPAASPKRNRKNMGIPDQKDLLEQKAAHECLTTMIADCKSIFSVPEEMLSKCRLSYIEQGDPVSIEELMKRRTDSDVADHTAYMESCIQGLLRESHNKFKGWMSVSSSSSTDAAYKKVGDGHPLRLWKCAVDVEAPPIEVLNRVLHERHLWDEDLLKWRVVEKLDAETDVFQYVLNNMAPHPTRDFTELRSWRTNLPKGACVLVSTSVEHPEANLIGGLRAVVLASRYLIEPCGSGKSRLTHMCRIDLRGHTPEWYNKAYGHLCANYVIRIRDSFKQDIASTAGPETKV